MTSKEQEQPIIPPPPAANGHARRDSEAAHDARELREQRRRKCLLYIVLFIIFQPTVVAVFMLTVMKIKTPKLSVRSATFDDFKVNNHTTNPSLTARMNVELGIKNSNFGRFRYETSTVHFLYGGKSIGEATVSDSYAHWRSTRRSDVAVNLDFGGVRSDPRFARDLNYGVVPVLSQATFRGKVELLYVIEKGKVSNMNCSMEILAATQQLRNIVCS